MSKLVTYSEKWNGVTYVGLQASLQDVELGWRVSDDLNWENHSPLSCIRTKGYMALLKELDDDRP